MFENYLPVLLVGVGGSLGAISRYLIAGLFKESKYLPWGTFTVNVLGSFLLGLVVTLSLFNLISSNFLVFFGIGFLGSFTTMSSFVVETLRLSDNSMQMAFLNLLVMMVFVFIGGVTGRQLAGVIVARRI
ncbi:MAG: fluoride efflux transporter CrcB [Candidatus Heimdallarchaeota archaeon]|nr:fluoride efflux transporter CrcB [Candidatus Heimdallarchaeota archaeon]